MKTCAFNVRLKHALNNLLCFPRKSTFILSYNMISTGYNEIAYVKTCLPRTKTYFVRKYSLSVKTTHESLTSSSQSAADNLLPLTATCKLILRSGLQATIKTSNERLFYRSLLS